MTDTSLDRRPVILAVDDEDASRAVLERSLSGRYGRDYRVVTEASPTAAFDRLRSLRDADSAVALIIADQWMPEEMGTAFLARTRDLHPPGATLRDLNLGRLQRQRAARFGRPCSARSTTSLPVRCPTPTNNSTPP